MPRLGAPANTRVFWVDAHPDTGPIGHYAVHPSGTAIYDHKTIAVTYRRRAWYAILYDNDEQKFYFDSSTLLPWLEEHNLHGSFNSELEPPQYNPVSQADSQIEESIPCQRSPIESPNQFELLSKEHTAPPQYSPKPASTKPDSPDSEG